MDTVREHRKPEEWEADDHIEALKEVWGKSVQSPPGVCAHHVDLLEDRKAQAGAMIWQIRHAALNGHQPNGGEAIKVAIGNVKIEGKGTKLGAMVITALTRLAMLGGLAWLILNKG